jgi:RNA polymerase sigma-70 factor (ECF subfamily)
MIEFVLSDRVTSNGSDLRERLGRLFDDQHQRLYRLALRMATDDDAARDLVQETFLRAAERASSLPDDESAAEAWLVRVLVNLCRDRFRRLRVRRDHAAAHPTRDAVQDHESAVVAASTVRKALERLDPRRRAIVVLHELEGLDDKAVARMLGVSSVTVRWHLAKGRRELAAIIDPGRKA